MQKQTQQLMLMLVIGVLIGTTAVMAWRTRSGNETPSSSQTTTSGVDAGKTEINATTSTITQAQNFPTPPQIPANIRVGLSVADQPAGDTVNVSGLTLTENHWVAIYDEKDGHPGWILGAARAHAGDASASVLLLRKSEVGKKYYAAILTDDGDDIFNRLSDLPPLTPDKVVIVSFLAK